VYGFNLPGVEADYGAPAGWKGLLEEGLTEPLQWWMIVSFDARYARPIAHNATLIPTVVHA